jgi:hypothetical protein
VTRRSTEVVAIIVEHDDIDANDSGRGCCLGATCDAAIGVELLRGIDTVLQGNCSAGGMTAIADAFFPPPN